MCERLQTVVETNEFKKQAEKIARRGCIDDFISHIAKKPDDGVIIRGTAGARKIRWAIQDNKGKSSGMRVIYYYLDYRAPIFLFTAYGKNQKANISQAEKNILRNIIKQIDTYYMR